MIEGMAEYYSSELSQKVKRGMRESCLKGNAAGIQPIYGYCIVDKKYQIVPEEAEIVRKMFDDYVNGTTIKEITTWLDESGIRTHRGNRFSIGRVSLMLRNQKYIGKCEYAGEVYDNIIMPIVDELTFNRTQELLVVNSHKSGRVRAGEKFILSGKLSAHIAERFIMARVALAGTAIYITFTSVVAKRKAKTNAVLTPCLNMHSRTACTRR